MECMIFVILTNEHAGLNEGLAIAKSMQTDGEIALLTYDLSHLKRCPLSNDTTDSIKDIIESMSKYYDDVEVKLVVDEVQIISVIKFFSDTNYNVKAYVMGKRIDLND